MRRDGSARKHSGTWFLDAIKVIAWPSLPLVLRTKRIYANAQAKPPLQGPAVIVSNHACRAEPIVMIHAFFRRRISFLCSKSAFDVSPFCAWILRHVGCVPIDHANFNLDCMMELIRRLRQGGTVCIFPEGRLESDGTKLLPFKGGAVTVALQAGAPIIPVYIQSGRPVLDRCRIVIGEPIDIAACFGHQPPSVSRVNAAAAMLYEKIESLKQLCEEAPR